MPARLAGRPIIQNQALYPLSCISTGSTFTLHSLCARPRGPKRLFGDSRSAASLSVWSRGRFPSASFASTVFGLVLLYRRGTARRGFSTGTPARRSRGGVPLTDAALRTKHGITVASIRPDEAVFLDRYFSLSQGMAWTKNVTDHEPNPLPRQGEDSESGISGGSGFVACVIPSCRRRGGSGATCSRRGRVGTLRSWLPCATDHRPPAKPASPRSLHSGTRRRGR